MLPSWLPSWLPSRPLVRPSVTSASPHRSRTHTSFPPYLVPASAQVLEPTDDLCFAKIAAAYDAYKTNGLKGNADSLIPHLYSDYTKNVRPGIFCYRVNSTDIPRSTVVGTYLGGLPGETMYEAENKGNKTKTDEQLIGDNGAWTDYVGDPNLCCGPERSFFYCSPRIGDAQNIKGCSQTPQYKYVPSGEPGTTTTLGTMFNNTASEDGAIFCGCVLNANGTETLLEQALANFQPIIQEYSRGDGSQVGVMAAMAACLIAALV